jgi:PAS domain-containing protein
MRAMNQHLDLVRPGAAQTVTASELVRQFGLWQERAVHAPVYVLHRGRPRLALASIELMEALCSARLRDRGAAGLDALLDAIREIVVIVDGDLAVVRMSGAARRYFDLDGEAGLTLDRLGGRVVADFLADRARRAIERGLAETVEIAATRRPGRRLSIDILPWGDGAALTGIAVETLASVRFVTLLEVGSRVAVADAIEAVIADGVPRGVTARMPVNRADVRSIRIGLSLLRRGVAPDGVAAVLVGDRLEKP